MNLLHKTLTQNKVVFNRVVLQLMLILFLVEFIKGAVLVSILPLYLSMGLGFSKFLIGWTMSLQYLGDNFFRSPTGWIVDHFGYKRVLVVGMLIMFASLSVIMVASTPLLIMAASALLGIGSSPLWPAVISVATEKVGSQLKGTIMSTIYVAWLAGSGLGPVFINMFIHDQSFGTAFKLLIVFVVAAVLAALWLPHKAAKMTDQTIHINKSARRPLHAAEWIQHSAAKVKNYIVEAVQSQTVSKTFLAAMFAQNLAIGILVPVVTLYPREVLGLSSAEFNTFLIVGGAITVAFLIPVGKLVDRFGVHWFLVIGFFVASVTLLLFTSARSMILISVMASFLGAGYACIIPAWNVLIASVVPENKRGATWGFFLTIEGLGLIVGPIISGKLWDVLGYRAPFIASSIVLISLLLLEVFVFHRNKIMVR